MSDENTVESLGDEVSAIDAFVNEAMSKEPEQNESLVESNHTTQKDEEDSATSEKVESENTENDSVQTRINQLVAKRYAEKRRADEAEARAKELEERLNHGERHDNSSTHNAIPTLESCEYDDALYQQKIVEYYSTQVKAAAREEALRAQRENESARVSDNFDKKSVSFMEKHQDYIDVIQEIPKLHDEVRQIIVTADNGPELAYYLGKHLDVASQISNATPAQAAYLLGELQATLGRRKTAANKTTKAPEPIEPVASGSTLSPDVTDTSMSMDEWMRRFGNS